MGGERRAAISDGATLYAGAERLEMASKQKRPAIHGTLIPVKELGDLRVFYSDVLQLGAPQVDSNFWVEYGLPGGGTVILVQDASAIPTKTRPAASWLLLTEHFAEEQARLVEAKVRQLRPAMEVPGFICATFADPEGNPFTLLAHREDPV